MKIAWKTIKGNGPYAYLQKTVKNKHGVATGKHIAYLGKIGNKVVPMDKLAFANEVVVVPYMDAEVFDSLKQANQDKMHPMWILPSVPVEPEIKGQQEAHWQAQPQQKVHNALPKPQNILPPTLNLDERGYPTGLTKTDTKMLDIVEGEEAPTEGVTPLKKANGLPQYATPAEIQLVSQHPDVLDAGANEKMDVAQALVVKIKRQAGKPSMADILTLRDHPEVKAVPGPERLKKATNLAYKEQIKKAVAKEIVVEEAQGEAEGLADAAPLAEAEAVAPEPEKKPATPQVAPLEGMAPLGLAEDEADSAASKSKFWGSASVEELDFKTKQLAQQYASMDDFISAYWLKDLRQQIKVVADEFVDVPVPAIVKAKLKSYGATPEQVNEIMAAEVAPEPVKKPATPQVAPLEGMTPLGLAEPEPTPFSTIHKSEFTDDQKDALLTTFSQLKMMTGAKNFQMFSDGTFGFHVGKNPKGVNWVFVRKDPNTENSMIVQGKWVTVNNPTGTLKTETTHTFGPDSDSLATLGGKWAYPYVTPSLHESFKAVTGMETQATFQILPVQPEPSPALPVKAKTPMGHPIQAVSGTKDDTLKAEQLAQTDKMNEEADQKVTSIAFAKHLHNKGFLTAAQVEDWQTLASKPTGPAFNALVNDIDNTLGTPKADELGAQHALINAWGFDPDTLLSVIWMEKGGEFVPTGINYGQIRNALAEQKKAAKITEDWSEQALELSAQIAKDAEDDAGVTTTTSQDIAAAIAGKPWSEEKKAETAKAAEVTEEWLAAEEAIAQSVLAEPKPAQTQIAEALTKAAEEQEAAAAAKTHSVTDGGSSWDYSENKFPISSIDTDWLMQKVHSLAESVKAKKGAGVEGNIMDTPVALLASDTQTDPYEVEGEAVSGAVHKIYLGLKSTGEMDEKAKAFIMEPDGSAFITMEDLATGKVMDFSIVGFKATDEIGGPLMNYVNAARTYNKRLKSAIENPHDKQDSIMYLAPDKAAYDAQGMAYSVKGQVEQTHLAEQAEQAEEAESGLDAKQLAQKYGVGDWKEMADTLDEAMEAKLADPEEGWTYPLKEEAVAKKWNEYWDSPTVKDMLEVSKTLVSVHNNPNTTEEAKSQASQTVKYAIEAVQEEFGKDFGPLHAQHQVAMALDGGTEKSTKKWLMDKGIAQAGVFASAKTAEIGKLSGVLAAVAVKAAKEQGGDWEQENDKLGMPAVGWAAYWDSPKVFHMIEAAKTLVDVHNKPETGPGQALPPEKSQANQAVKEAIAEVSKEFGKGFGELHAQEHGVSSALSSAGMPWDQLSTLKWLNDKGVTQAGVFDHVTETETPTEPEESWQDKLDTLGEPDAGWNEYWTSPKVSQMLEATKELVLVHVKPQFPLTASEVEAKKIDANVKLKKAIAEVKEEFGEGYGEVHAQQQMSYDLQSEGGAPKMDEKDLKKWLADSGVTQAGVFDHVTETETLKANVPPDAGWAAYWGAKSVKDLQEKAKNFTNTQTHDFTGEGLTLKEIGHKKGEANYELFQAISKVDKEFGKGFGATTAEQVVGIEVGGLDMGQEAVHDWMDSEFGKGQAQSTIFAGAKDWKAESTAPQSITPTSAPVKAPTASWPESSVKYEQAKGMPWKSYGWTPENEYMKKYYQQFLDKGMDIGSVVFLARSMALKGQMDVGGWENLAEFEKENSKDFKEGWGTSAPAPWALWKMVHAVGIQHHGDAQALISAAISRGYITTQQANEAIKTAKAQGAATAHLGLGEEYIQDSSELAKLQDYATGATKLATLAKESYDQEAAVKKHAAQIAAVDAAEEGAFIPHHDAGTTQAAYAQTLGGVKHVEGLEPVAEGTQVPWYTTVDEVSTGAAKAGVPYNWSGFIFGPGGKTDKPLKEIGLAQGAGLKDESITNYYAALSNIAKKQKNNEILKGDVQGIMTRRAFRELAEGFDQGGGLNDEQLPLNNAAAYDLVNHSGLMPSLEGTLEERLKEAIQKDAVQPPFDKIEMDAAIYAAHDEITNDYLDAISDPEVADLENAEGNPYGEHWNDAKITALFSYAQPNGAPLRIVTTKQIKPIIEGAVKAQRDYAYDVSDVIHNTSLDSPLTAEERTEIVKKTGYKPWTEALGAAIALEQRGDEGETHVDHPEWREHGSWKAHRLALSAALAKAGVKEKDAELLVKEITSRPRAQKYNAMMSSGVPLFEKSPLNKEYQTYWDGTNIGQNLENEYVQSQHYTSDFKPVETVTKVQKLGGYKTVPAEEDPKAQSVLPKADPSLVTKTKGGKPHVAPYIVKKLENIAASGDVAELKKVAAALHSTVKALDTKPATKAFNAVVESLTEQMGGNDATGGQGQFIADLEAKGEEVVIDPSKAKDTPESRKRFQKLKDQIASGKTVDWDKDLVYEGGQKGSNEGALYQSKALQKPLYVKWNKTSLHNANEVLANRLYSLFGVPVPYMRQGMVKNQSGAKKDAVLSEWVTDAATMDSAAMAAHPDVQKGFVADAWLGNWDVAGLGYDNVVQGQGDQAYRIDPGGAMMFRAQGSPKNVVSGEDFGAEVYELDTLRSAVQNAQAASIFSKLTDKQIDEGAKTLGGINDIMIDSIVDSAGIPTEIPQDVKDAYAGQPSYLSRIPSNPNAFYKERLKKRRDNILQQRLGQQTVAEVSLDVLKGKSTLSDASVEKIAALAPELTYGASAESKKLFLSVLKAEMGATEGKAAYDTFKKWMQMWKGTMSPYKEGSVMRVAAAAANYYPNDPSKGLAAGLKELGDFLEKGHQGEKKQHVAFVKKTLTSEEGARLINAIKYSGQMHKVLFGVQFGNAQDPTPLIKAGRGWNSTNQVGHELGKVMRANNPPLDPNDKALRPKVGDFIIYDRNPSAHSWSINNAWAGVQQWTGQVPAEAVFASDRLNNLTGTNSSEDEVVFCCPVTQMKIVSDSQNVLNEDWPNE